VFTAAQLESFQACHRLKGKPVQIHIKVDTGMHRIGIDYREAAEFIGHCQAQDYLDVQGVFTHLACSEDPEVTRIQYERWESVLAHLPLRPKYVHFANSLGAVAFPHGQYNLVRMGLAFYGYLSDASGWGEGFNGLDLKPVMGLKARIIRLMEIAPGEGVSYGYSFHAPSEQPARIATVPLGYADGIPRLLSNRIEALYKKMRVPQVGNITMDQMMFDVTAIPQVQLGETLTLLGAEDGQSITLSQWAGALGTLEYELMCALRVRLPKTYSRPAD
jgi:alanine racemase